MFREFLRSINLECALPVIDAKGNNNQLPRFRKEMVQTLRDMDVSKVFILTDKDQKPCFTFIKELINPGEDEKVVVCVKQLEAWFLADETAMTNYLGGNVFHCENPESFDVPLDEIKRIRLEKTGKGVSDKLMLAKNMIKSGFSIERASTNSASANYFIEQLKAVAS